MKTDAINEDILDDVKLLLASIRFGENYTEYSTIQEPEKFLRALIHNRKVGLHSANASDYILLEKRGIVKVSMGSKYSSYTGKMRTGYCMELLKKDVAQEALRIIESKEYNINISDNDENYDIASTVGSFISPEEARIKMGVMPEPVREAEEYLNKVQEMN